MLDGRNYITVVTRVHSHTRTKRDAPVGGFILAETLVLAGVALHFVQGVRRV